MMIGEKCSREKMIAAAGGGGTPKGKGKRLISSDAKKERQRRKPLADRTNTSTSTTTTRSLSQPSSSSFPAVRATELFDDVAGPGSVYTRRKCKRKSSGSHVVTRLAENEGDDALFKSSTEEDAAPPSMLSKSLTEPPRNKRLRREPHKELPQDFIQKQKAYFAEVDAFELPVEEASSDELD